MGSRLTLRQKAGAFVLAVFVLLPAMLVSGFLVGADGLPLWQWVAIAAVGGAVGCFLLAPQAPALAAVGGLLSGALTPFAVDLYVSLRAGLTETFLIVELLIPAGLAAVPGLLLYRFGRRVRPADSGPR